MLVVMMLLTNNYKMSCSGGDENGMCLQLPCCLASSYGRHCARCTYLKVCIARLAILLPALRNNGLACGIRSSLPPPSLFESVRPSQPTRLAPPHPQYNVNRRRSFPLNTVTLTVYGQPLRNASRHKAHPPIDFSYFARGTSHSQCHES